MTMDSQSQPTSSLAEPTDPRHMIWVQICEDAKTKNAFPAAHFGRDGLLNPCERVYKSLINWVFSIEDANTFETFVPMWEHRGGGQWELFLIEMDSWLHVSIDNRNKPIAQKPSGKRKLSKGSMVVPGNCPLNGKADDVDVVDDFGEAADD